MTNKERNSENIPSGDIKRIKKYFIRKLGRDDMVRSVAFYGNPPKKDTDLDILLVVTESDGSELDEILQNASNQFRLRIDSWILTSDQLAARMKRIAGMNASLPKPEIIDDIEHWEGFGFIPIINREFLKEKIDHCYSNPEPGGPIKPTIGERRIYAPGK